MIELYTYTYVYILKRDDLLEFLTRSGLLVQQWLFPDGKAKDLVVVQFRRLMSLLPWSGAGVLGHPREQLLFGLPWHHEEVGSNTREGMPQQQVGELARSEGKQASLVLFCGLPPGMWFRFGVGLSPQMIQSRKSLTGAPSCLGFWWWQI